MDFMKRYMWHLTARVGQDSMGLSCSDPARLVKDALRSNASVICLIRGKEIKGKLPTLEQMRGLFAKRIHRRAKHRTA
jgi:hypothetical protein